MAEGWQVPLLVDPPSKAVDTSRAELQRILEGLVWP
jgi:hypothetical protein